MHRILAAAALCLALGACSTLNALTSTTVTQQQVVIAANAFDAVEATATQYALLPRGTCSLCSSVSVLKAIKPPILAGRADRDALEAWVNGGPQPVNLSALYKGLNAAVKTLKTVLPKTGA